MPIVDLFSDPKVNQIHNSPLSFMQMNNLIKNEFV